MRNTPSTMSGPIMTVKEFRKLAGKDARDYSDTQIEEMIAQLDLIAGLFIKQVNNSAVPKSPLGS